jgi:hypothetical protein
VKEQLRRELEAKAGSEVVGSLLHASVEVKAEDVMVFVNPGQVWAIIGGVYANLSGGREDLTEDERDSLLGQAMAAKQGEVDAYLKECSARARDVKAGIVERSAGETAMIAASEAVEFARMLAASKSLDHLLYQQVRGQLQGALPGLPEDMAEIVRAWLVAVDEVLEVLDEARASATAA